MGLTPGFPGEKKPGYIKYALKRVVEWIMLTKTKKVFYSALLDVRIQIALYYYASISKGSRQLGLIRF